jgi:hypothetical protein
MLCVVILSAIMVAAGQAKNIVDQGNLTEGEGSVQLISLY